MAETSRPYDHLLDGDVRPVHPGLSRYEPFRCELIPVEPSEAEMAAALAPLFAPVPTRDSDLPAVVSPCA